MRKEDSSGTDEGASPPLEFVTRGLVNTVTKDISVCMYVCETVFCKLNLTSFVSRNPSNPITNPNPSYSHPCNDNIFSYMYKNRNECN
jgi:hypothetical protein